MEPKLLQRLIDECKEIDTLTVVNLRTMSDASVQGLKRVLACFVGYPDHFHIVEQYTDKY